MEPMMLRSVMFFAVLFLAVPAWAGGADPAEFFALPGDKATPPLCLTAEPKDNPVISARLMVSAKGEGANRDGRLAITFAASKTTFRMGLDCAPAGAGGKRIECVIPCGDGATLDLDITTDGNVTAKLDLADGVLAKIGAVTTGFSMQSSDPAECRPKD